MNRWGIIGTGGVATRFARTMARVDDGEVVAVSSRSGDRAATFADDFSIGARYDNVSKLVADPDVDIVYVATPHAQHEDDTIRCLEGGKHVLCEKAFALNATQARRMITAATGGPFLMEAMWSRFLPAYRALVELIGQGGIGQPVQVEAEFGWRTPFDETSRLFDPHQGGGALLDLGIYSVQLCSLVLGPIEGVAANGSVTSSGVDDHVVALLEHRGGGIGVAKAALAVPMACTARISGTEGWIDLPAFMHCPREFTVNRPGAEPEVIDCSFDGDGFEFEIAEVHRCIASGLTESPTMPLAESLALMIAMDDIRSQLGVTYPGETA